MGNSDLSAFQIKKKVKRIRRLSLEWNTIMSNWNFSVFESNLLDLQMFVRIEKKDAICGYLIIELFNFGRNDI